ncbi:MAG: response regulator [Planctomycetota bacterium]|jgi:DNA-binding response OmpR family regulator
MIKLLIVDDDLPTCDFLRAFFSRRNYQVFTATDGNKALFIVKEKHPNIILLDIKMPGLSGIEVLQKIKEIDRDVKVIMMTAIDEEIVVKLAMNYGATDYITKPFSLEYLEKDVFLKVLKQLV